MGSENLHMPCPKCGATVFKSAKNCPKCGAKLADKKSLFKKIGIGFLVLVALIFIWPSKETKTTSASQTLARQGNNLNAANKDELFPELVNLDWSWSKEGFGTVMKVNFVVENLNAFDIKDIKVKCESFGSSGTKIDSNERVIYEVFPSKVKKKVRDFNMGLINSQAAKTNCSVVSYTRN